MKNQISSWIKALVMKSGAKFFFSCLILFPLWIQGQPQPDVLRLVFDRPFYVVGEDIWYQVVASGTKLDDIRTKIVHVEWINPDGKIVRHQKLRLNPGIAAGDLAIPADWKEGMYQVRVYSHWNLNFEPVPMTEYSIPIYEMPDASDLAQIQGIIASTEVLMPEPHNHSAGLELSVSADTVSFREEIQCKLGLKEPDRDVLYAQLAVQVNHMEQIGNEPTDWKASQVPEAMWKGGNNAIPAEEKLIMGLEVRTAGTNQPHTTGFLEAFVQESRFIFYGRSDEGIARFEVDNLVGPATLQCFDVNPFDLRTSLNVKALEAEVPVPDPVPAKEMLSLNPVVARYLLAKLEKNAMITLLGKEAAWTPQDAPLVQKDWPILQRYDLGKYVQFEDLFHFTKEAVLSVANRRDKSGILGDPRFHQYIYVRTFTKTGAEIPPEIRDNRPTLYGINGYFTYDINPILAQAWKDVERLEVYNILEAIQEYFGRAGNGGVIHLVTKDGKTPPELLNSRHFVKVEGYYANRFFQSTEPDPTLEGESRLPDQRPTLFWRPAFFLSAIAESEFSVVLGDQAGWHRILARGVTNKGELVEAEHWVFVRKPGSD